MQAPVASPKGSASAQANRGEQMDIDVAEPPSKEPLPLNEAPNLFVCRSADARQIAKCLKKSVTRTDVSDGQFAHDERVRQHPVLLQQFVELRVPDPKVIDPNRRIDQDHDASERRRGTGETCG